MKKTPQSLTSLPPSPDDERRGRMTKYLIMMTIRIVCLILILFVREWWAVALLAAGAVLLPYFAVVVGNVGTSWVSKAERPSAIEVYRRPEGPVVPPAPAPAPEGPRT
jgi:amino acid transporter